MHHHGVVLGRACIQRLRRHDVIGQPPRRAHLMPGHDRVAAIPPDRIARDTQLARNRLRTPPAIRPLANRGDDLSFDHRYLRRWRYQIPSLKLHSTLLPKGVRINGARGSISLPLYSCQFFAR